MSNDNEQGYAYSHKFSEPYTYMEVYTMQTADHSGRSTTGVFQSISLIDVRAKQGRTRKCLHLRSMQ